MRRIITILTGAAPLLGVGISAPLVAQEAAETKPVFGASIGVGTQQSDNARKSEQNPIEERQDDFTASMNASWRGNWSSIEADYHYLYKNYSKDSQVDRNTLEGSAELQMGFEDDPVSLAIRHSNQAQYNTPEDVEISDNLDEKQILGAEPILRLFPSTVDTLAVTGSYEDVSYRYNDIRDSERAGASAFWSRRLSRTDYMQLTAGTIDVEYPNSPNSNYKKDYAHITYGAQLRTLSYSVLAGVNRASFADNSEDQQSPTYRGTLNYISALHQLSLSASQEFTDSSYGSGGNSGLVPGDPSDGVGVDQIERRVFGLDWRTSALCKLCEGKLFVQLRDDNYRRLDEDSVERAAGLTFSYRISEASTASGTYTLRREDFDSESKSDLDRENLGLSLTYKFSSDLSTSLFYTFESRQYVDDGSSYDENVVGISMNYTLK